MTSTHAAWEREYRQRQLITGDDRPQASVRRFLKFLKKQDVAVKAARVLDLGTGTGRNALAFARLGAAVSGIDIAPTAIDMARKAAAHAEVTIDYRISGMGSPLPYPDASFDIVLDVTSSNSLTEREREVYLAEVKRVLAPGGWFFVRALSKDGDKNAQNLLKLYPGAETDTYIFPGLGITERIFSEADLRELYGQYFQFKNLERDEGYARFKNQSYKRKYWVAFLQAL